MCSNWWTVVIGGNLNKLADLWDRGPVTLETCGLCGLIAGNSAQASAVLSPRWPGEVLCSAEGQPVDANVQLKKKTNVRNQGTL